MAGEGGYDIGVLNFLIEVTDEGAAGHMASSNFAYRLLVFFPGERIYYCHHPVDADYAEHLADALVVLLRRDERQQATIGKFVVLAEDRLGRLVEWYNYGTAVFLDGLGRNIFYSAVDYVPTCEPQKVADAAADIALEYEHVPLFLQFPGECLVLRSALVILEIEMIYTLHLILGEIHRSDIVFSPRGCGGVFLSGMAS